MRLIDADKLDVNNLPFTRGQCRTVKYWLDLYKEEDARLTIHAHWTRDSENNLICSHCGQIHGGGFCWCSYCGAKMDEKGE